jgi:hypothetical protein
MTTIRHALLITMAAVFAAGISLSVTAQVATGTEDQAEARPPVCALVDTTKSPIATLLEARLLAIEGSTWVERTEIDRLLAEQELQGAFAADASKKRAALGKLLKADVLVLLRQAKSDSKKASNTIECVVCETKHGLRLKTATVDATKTPDSVLTTFQDTFQRALDKYAEKVSVLVAVPPFISDDLGLSKNYLQSAFAKLADQELLDRPGILVLELQEAQAISRELAVAGDADRVERRQAPWYLLGRYRHEGLRDQQRLRISLQLMQGEQQVAEKRHEGLKPVAAGEWIRVTTAELIGKVKQTAGSTSPAFTSPKAEALRLAERGRQFQQVGSWPEALALYEASLLLNPTSDDVRASAVEVTAALVKSTERSHLHGDWIPPLLAAYERGLEHLEIWLRTAPDLADSLKPGTHYNFAVNLENAFPVQVAGKVSAWAEHQSEVKEVIERRRETYLRIALARAKDKRVDFARDRAWDARAVTMMPAKERYALILQLAEEWRDLPNLHERITRMALAHGIHGRDDLADQQEFIKRLKQSDSLQWKIAANSIQENVALGKIYAERLRPIIAPASEEKFDSRLLEVKLGDVNQVGQQNAPQAAIQGEPGISYLLGFRAIHRMGETDSKPIYFGQAEQESLSSAVFDGHYVWFVRQAKNERIGIVAVDPTTKRQYYITSAQGLPTTEGTQKTAGRDHAMAISPLNPGMVCVAGFTGRSWIATASIDGQGDRHFDIFFEAREAETSDAAQRSRSEVVFYPLSAFTMKEPGNKGGRRVLVRRDYVQQAGFRNPLLVDPIEKTVAVAPYELYDPPVSNNLTADDGTLFVSEHHFSDHSRLMRIKYPGTTKEKFVPKIPDGLLAADKHGVHIVGRHWSIVNLQTGEIETLVEKAGWHYRATVRTLEEATSLEARTIPENGYSLDRLLTASPYGVVAVLRNREGERTFKLEADRKDQGAGP